MATLGSSAFIEGRFDIDFAALGEKEAGRLVGGGIGDAVKISY